MSVPYEYGELQFSSSHEETPNEETTNKEKTTPASWGGTDVTSDFGEASAELAMSDPFELRLHFSNRLRALNPCDDNTEEVVSFALRHRELDEDLHSCILEQLESEENNINVRANIFYFLVDLCELARREKHYPYICMIERDFPKMIDAAIPLDGLGIVNTNCVRYVLEFLHFEYGVFRTTTNTYIHNLTIRQFAETKTFDELMAYLDRRVTEARPELMEASSDDESEPDMSWIKNIKRPADVFPSSSQNGTTASSAAEGSKKKAEEAAAVSPMAVDDQPEPAPEFGHMRSRSRSQSFSTLGSSPRPPTPLSPSYLSDDSNEPNSPTQGEREFSPAVPSVNNDEQPSAGSPMQSANELAGSHGASPARVSAEPSTNLNPAPINPSSPQAFTPVQKEDANMFTPKYLELVTQRMEQDRERQRKKEDNSGFLAVSGDLDEEIQQMSDKAKAWTKEDFEKMAKEKRDWDLARGAV